MPNRLTVEPATEAHAAQLAAHLRADEAQEMLALNEMPQEALVPLARVLSHGATCIMDGRNVVAMFGVIALGAHPGIWLIASRLVSAVPIAFMRACRLELRRLLEAWGMLFSAIRVGNQRSLRFAEALGFDICGPVPFGVSGPMVCPIVIGG